MSKQSGSKEEQVVPVAKWVPESEEQAPAAVPAVDPVEKAKQKKWIIGAIVVCCVSFLGATVVTILESKELAKANELWEAGQKAEAVEIYKSVMQRHTERLPRRVVLERIIDFEAERGNTSAAEGLIAKAVQENVSLDLKEPKATELLAQARAQQEARAKAKEAQAKARAAREAAANEGDAEEASLSALGLINGFDNEISGNSQYGGKRVTVWGTVLEVKQDYPPGGWSKKWCLTVGGQPGPNGYTSWLECFFSSSSKKLGALRNGEQATITGEVHGKRGCVVTLTDCKVKN
jgi:hypothetical protein